MIERKFVAQRLKEFQIQEYISKNLNKVGHSHTKMQRTPLGEKIVIFASRPGLIVGRKGGNIQQLTKVLKKRFNLENPQIEINEVENVYLDARIVAEMIANSLEKFGASRFKSIGHKMMTLIMGAGAMGVEILISGKIPGSRAKTWRFYQGYLKKNGDVAINMVDKFTIDAQLKSGTVGIQVRIMGPDTKLPDDINFIEDLQEVKEEKSEEKKTEIKEEVKTEEKEPKEEEEPETEVKEEKEDKEKIKE